MIVTLESVLQCEAMGFAAVFTCRLICELCLGVFVYMSHSFHFSDGALCSPHLILYGLSSSQAHVTGATHRGICQSSQQLVDHCEKYCDDSKVPHRNLM